MWVSGKGLSLVIRSTWVHKLVQALKRTLMRFLIKLKVELPYDPAVPLLGTYPEKMTTLIWKDIHTPMFMTTLFTIAKTRKYPKCPQTGEWTKKMWYIHAVEYCSAIMEEWNIAILLQNDGLKDNHTKRSKSDISDYHTKSEKDKYYVV